MGNECVIIPAIIAKSQEELEERIGKVKAHASVLQLDYMDGVFVPNTSLDFDFRLPETGCRLEAHLMVADPDGWIRKNSSKVDTILAHIESCADPAKTIKLAKTAGKRFGFAVNPKTPLSAIEPYLGELDEVLVMTVNPGFYGSPFLPETLEKVKRLRRLRPLMDLEVDGGITADTIGQAHAAGANMFVSGSYIVKSDDPAQAIKAMREKIGL